MRIASPYSLEQDRLVAERQQASIRIMLAVISIIVLIASYIDRVPLDPTEPTRIISLGQIISLSSIFMSYSLAMWVMLRWWSTKIIMTASSLIEIVLITYLYQQTQGLDAPFYVWYIFYVVSVAIRYGLRYLLLALSASIVSLTSVVYMAAPANFTANTTFVLGYASFLFAIAFMFGQLHARQMSYLTNLFVVSEFRAELAGLVTAKELINHLIARVKDLLKAEQVFFLPAKRGADASQAPGLRSQGSDPVLMSIFREGSGVWNVEEILREQRPNISNNPFKDASFPRDMAEKLGLRNLTAAPMMVKSVPVGVIYAANRRDKCLSAADMHLLELVAAQAAPLVESALLWERFRKAAVSDERHCIARDIHDRHAQTLAAIKMHLERCKILMYKDASRAVEGIDKVYQIAIRGLAEVRLHSSELRSTRPEPSRFCKAIQRYAADAAAKGGFETVLDIQTLEEPIAPNVALVVFQIARELLSNVASHASASTVYLKLHVEGEELTLEIEDNGIGFDVTRVRAEKASQGSLGLIGIEQRARQFDGVLTLASEPGKGTRACVRLMLYTQAGNATTHE